MKKRKTVLLAGLMIAILVISGCSRANKLSREGASNGDSAFTESGKETLITDSTELRELWNKYLYFSIPSIGNSDNFNSPEEINPIFVAYFCFDKYIEEHGVEKLDLEGSNSSRRLLPLETVLEYAKKYFNLNTLDTDKLSKYEYDSIKKAFIIGRDGRESIPSYDEKNAWGVYIDKALRGPRGELTVSLGYYDTYENKRTNQLKTYTLIPNKDGTMYFTKLTTKYINNNLVKLTGNYKKFEEIQGFKGDLSELSMVVEDGNNLIMIHTPYTETGKATIMLIDKDKLIVTKELKLEVKLGPNDIKCSGDKLILCLNDKILTVNRNLENLTEVKLPKLIIEKINRIPRHDENGNSDIFFGGYDVSNDFKGIVYTDEIGVKYLEIETNKERLLSKSLAVEGSELIKRRYHYAPKFIAGDKKIITSITDYEGVYGFSISNVKAGTSKLIHMPGQWSVPPIRYDSGLLFVNAFQNNGDRSSDMYKTLYLDLSLEKVLEVKLNASGDTGYMMPDYYSFIGQNYGAFVTSKSDGVDYANNMYFLNRLDINKNIVEENIISIKAAEIHILGVLGNGKVIFWYKFNEAEKGIGITQ